MDKVLHVIIIKLNKHLDYRTVHALIASLAVFVSCLVKNTIHYRKQYITIRQTVNCCGGSNCFL